MQNLIKYICIIILSLSCFSCKKYLEEKQNKSLVTLSTLDDLQAILDDESAMNRARTPSFGESSSDDYFLMPTTFMSLTQRDKAVYKWEPYNYNFSNDWSLNYFIVYNANLCLEKLQEIKRDDYNKDQWNNIKGSSLFFRAYSFLNLTWVYAKGYRESTASSTLGIVLRLGADFNVPSVRSNLNETYNRIIADAKESIMYLPEKPNHVMRPSKIAAYGLLARAYLSMGQYDSAYRYANLCLGGNNTLMDYNNDPFIININANVPFLPFNPEIIFYSEMNTSVQLHVPSRGKIDTLLYNSYSSSDLRKDIFFKNNSGYQQFKGSYAANANTLFSGIAVDEILLTRSECNARMGRIKEAMSDLNILMKNRWKNTISFVPYTAIDGSDALELIFLERRKELLMRGVRWMDIKRLNLEGQNIELKRLIDNQTFSLMPNDKYFALPLPSDIIQSSNIQQN